MLRFALTLPIGLAIASGLAGCGGGSNRQTGGTGAVVGRQTASSPAEGRSTAKSTVQGSTRAGTGSQTAGGGGSGSGHTYYRLVQYPDAGFGGFYGQIAAARHSIDMEMYELEDPVVERDLVAARSRGVTVRVLLDRDFHGETVNGPAFTYLKRHGVGVRWAPPGYIFHIKATTFDRRTTDISTANLTARYYSTSRDAEIIDTNPSQVHAVESTFAHDWSAGANGVPSAATVQSSGLVWSPNTSSGTAETALLAQITGARRSVDFESEELSDGGVIAALAADARRGVDCRIVMTASSEWDAAWRQVRSAGCHVHVLPDSSSSLYIHEKLILDDHGRTGQSLLIGSQNASVTSLTRNRELSVLLHDAHGGRAVISRVARTFDADFGQAPPWKPAPSTSSGAPTSSATSTSSAPSNAGSGSQPSGSSTCHPLSSSGNCYEAGEFCADSQHGITGVAGNGEAIVCRQNGARWRWEPQ